MSNWWEILEDVYTNGYPGMVAILRGYDRPEFYYALGIVIIFFYFIRKIGNSARTKKWEIYTNQNGETIIPVVYSTLRMGKYFDVAKTSLTKIIIDSEYIYFYRMFGRLFGRSWMKKYPLKEIKNIDIATGNNYIFGVYKNTIMVSFDDKHAGLHFLLANEERAQNVLQFFSDKKIPLSETAKEVLRKKK